MQKVEEFINHDSHHLHEQMFISEYDGLIVSSLNKTFKFRTKKIYVYFMKIKACFVLLQKHVTHKIYDDCVSIFDCITQYLAHILVLVKIPLL